MDRPFRQIPLLFRPADESLTSTEKTQVQTCRLISLLGAIVLSLIGLLRFALPLDPADPTGVSFGGAGLLVGLCAATYASGSLRRRSGSWTQGGLYVVMAWGVAVVVLNQATGEYVLGLVLAYAGLVGAVGLSGGEGGSAWWFAGAGLLVTAAGFGLGPSPQTHPLAVLASMATAGAGVGIATHLYLSSQEDLRRPWGRWQHPVENLQEAVIITRGGEVAYANAEATTLFGENGQETGGDRSGFDPVAPEARENIQNRLEGIEGGQSTEVHEHRVSSHDGEERVVQSQSVPVQYEGQDAALTVMHNGTHEREIRNGSRDREVQNLPTQRTGLERLIVEISAGFIDTPPERIDRAIEVALGSVGSFVEADRSYVFLFDGDPEADALDEATQSNTHEWCAEGVASQKDDLQDIPCAAMPWWTEQMCRKEPLTIPKVADLPEAASAEQEILESQGIQSLAVLPMTQGENLVGFVGFDAVQSQIEWDEETVTILHVLGDAIFSALRRQEMEEKLREREERVRAITENVSEGLYRSTADEGLVYANQTFAKMFGYNDVEEVLEVDPATLYATPESRERLREAAKEQDSFDGEEGEFQRADGTTFVGLMSGSIIRDEAGNVQYYDGAITDITDRKKRERRLRVLSEAVEQAGDGIFITENPAPSETTPSILYANPAFEEMTGYKEEELLGRTTCLLRGPDTDPEVVASLQKAQAAGEPWSGETINYKKDGTPFVALWSTVPVRDNEGEIEYWASIQRDVTERREMEERLREREARLRGLANSIPGVVYQFATHPDGTHTTRFVSDHAESMLGISSDPDSFYDQFIERVPVSHRTDLRESAREAIEREERWRFEFPFEKPSGERIWLLGTSTPQRRDGTLISNGVLLDITERKAAERAVQEERDRFEMLFEGVPTPVVRYTAGEDGPLIADVNEAFETVFGVDRDEAEGRNIDRLLLPGGKTAVGIEGQILTDGPVQNEVQCEAADGLRDFRVQVTGRIRDTAPPEGHAIYTDITARKRRERALEETNATLEAILENLPPGVLAEDASRSVLAANESFCNILGLPGPAGELTGQDAATVTERTAEFFADDEAFVSRTRETFEQGEPVFDEEFALADGRVLERDFMPYELEEGTGALWVYRDVTERKEREQRLRVAKDEAQEASRMKSVFLANMSHEIRTPLTSIIGFAEAIGEEIEGNREGPIPRFAGLIEESGRRLLETLDAVLNLSKLEAGEMGLSPEPVPVTEEVEEMAELFGPRAEEEKIDLQVDVASDTPWVRADPGGLRIVLRNLVSNALKYTEEGGSVWVRVRPVDEEAAIEVEDTGVGMDPEEASALFRAFRQGSEGVAREYEGSGLGLAVSKRVLDEMDGAIEVETEKGEGTCFTVRLPVSRDGRRSEAATTQ